MIGEPSDNLRSLPWCRMLIGMGRREIPPREVRRAPWREGLLSSRI